MAAFTLYSKTRYVDLISENGNFGDLFWDSDGMKKMMCAKWDSWSMTNNVDSVVDGEEIKDDKSRALEEKEPKNTRKVTIKK